MAVIVNGEKIEDSEIQQEAERLRPAYEKAFADMDPQQREAQLLDWSKENMIERILFRQEVLNSDMNIPAEKLDEVLTQLKSGYKEPEKLYKDYNADDDDGVKENIKLLTQVRMKIGELNKNVPMPTSESIRNYYEQNKKRFIVPDAVRVSIIGITINHQRDEQTALDEITQIYQQYKNDTPFEFLVGGDKMRTTVVTRGQFPSEIEDVIFNLGIDQVSSVFRSRYGYHIAKVYEKRPPFIAGLQQVKDRIAEILLKQSRDNAFYNFLDKLKEKATIEEI